MIDQYTENKIVEMARYTIKHKATVRQTARAYKISKSCVFRYLEYVLPKLKPMMHKQVREVLEHNKATRSARGGEQTRLKFLRMKESAK